ncbi:MAG: heavy metal-associated domain-containing protein [Neisseria sp.]|nr:heavy metal-associated domain-containing protein [Neisseria sp.]
MAQLQVQVSGVSSKENADQLKAAGEALPGVKLVNVNFEDGRVVITHGDGFDVESFKKAAAALGFSVA